MACTKHPHGPPSTSLPSWRSEITSSSTSSSPSWWKDFQQRYKFRFLLSQISGHFRTRVFNLQATGQVLPAGVKDLARGVQSKVHSKSTGENVEKGTGENVQYWGECQATHVWNTYFNYQIPVHALPQLFQLPLWPSANSPSGKLAHAPLRLLSLTLEADSRSRFLQFPLLFAHYLWRSCKFFGTLGFIVRFPD